MAHVHIAKGVKLDMLNGPLLKNILVFAIPLYFVGVFQQLFNAADAAVVGRFVGAEALAAVGGVTPIISLVVNLFVGLSVGANVVIAVYIGHGETGRIKEAVSSIMALSLICGLVMTGVGIGLAGPVVDAIGTPAAVAPMATRYLQVYFAGSIFMMLYNFGSAILRSKGDSLRPLVALMASVLVNLGLNVLFVGTLGWGIDGVAWATVIACGVSAALVVAFLMREEGDFKLDLRNLKIDKGPLVHMLRIGVPAGLQGAVFSLSNVAIQSGINSFGAACIAGSAAAVNYEFFTYYLTTAFVQSAVTFIGQNFAAARFDRCKKIVVICLVGAFVGNAVLSVTFLMFKEAFLGIYTSDPAAMEYGAERMARVGLFQCIACSYEITAGAMRGMGRSMLPAVISVVGSCLLRFVWVFTVFAWMGSFKVLMDVYVVTWVITGTAMVIAFGVVWRKAIQEKGAQRFNSASKARNRKKGATVAKGAEPLY